jgi:hypothetical protein
MFQIIQSIDTISQAQQHKIGCGRPIQLDIVGAIFLLLLFSASFLIRVVVTVIVAIAELCRADAAPIVAAGFPLVTGRQRSAASALIFVFSSCAVDFPIASHHIRDALVAPECLTGVTVELV